MKSCHLTSIILCFYIHTKRLYGNSDSNSDFGRSATSLVFPFPSLHQLTSPSTTSAKIAQQPPHQHIVVVIAMAVSNLVIIVVVILVALVGANVAGDACLDPARDGEAALRAAFLKMNPAMASSTKSKFLREKS